VAFEVEINHPEPVDPPPATVTVTMSYEDAEYLYDLGMNFGGVGPHRKTINDLAHALSRKGITRSARMDDGHGYYLSLKGRASR
jgi:hypothetical protein